MRVRTGLTGAFAAACCFITAHASEFIVYNIVPFSPGREAEAAADAIELREKTGIDRPLYSLTLDPCREPLTNQIVEATASYRAFRAALEGADVRPGILVQAILGHAWRGEFGESNYLSLDASLAFEEVAVFRFSPFRPVRVTFTFDHGGWRRSGRRTSSGRCLIASPNWNKKARSGRRMVHGRTAQN